MNTTYLKHTICFYLAAIFGSWGIASCSQDEPVQQPVEKDTYTLSIQLSTQGIFTRADVELEDDPWMPEKPGDEDGDTFENSITSVDLFIYDDSSAPIKLIAVEDPDKPNYYTCEVTQDTPGVTIDRDSGSVSFTGKIMAVANAGNIGSPWSALTEWSNEKLQYDLNFGDRSWLIPMWGVESYSGITLEADKVVELSQPIYLLRAVSKIIIQLDSSIAGDFEISSIVRPETSPKMSKQGFILPNKPFTISSTATLHRETCFGMLEDAEQIDSYHFEGTSAWHTYVSESQTSSTNPFKFEVTLKSKNPDRNDITGTVYFSDYENYLPATAITNVVRNHIYEFTIRLSPLEFRTTVRKWEWGGKVLIDM